MTEDQGNFLIDISYLNNHNDFINNLIDHHRFRPRAVQPSSSMSFGNSRGVHFYGISMICYVRVVNTPNLLGRVGQRDQPGSKYANLH